jgi:geranylgeranyl pyrophosphate synthase
MEQVTRLLQEIAQKTEEPLGSKLRSILGGGKLLRPALVILVGQSLTAPQEPLHDLAVAVEILHTATLIHDDLVDEAQVRRGRETLHMSWPAGATVLAGDYLLAQSAALVAGLERPILLSVFAETLCTMCTGEIRQMCAPLAEQLSREMYYLRIEAKTASLCAAAAEMAAMLAEAGESLVAAARRFGWELGISFQIVDDVLDFTGDEARLGKPAGSDLRQRLVTLPTLLYLEQNSSDVAVSTVLSGRGNEKHVQAAIEAVCRSGAIEDALAIAQVHIEQAMQVLSQLPNSVPRQILHSLARYVVERNR